eukprot:TRINITY_DN3384_c0_g3_i2.p1 TRINITY_DN3384_c0_g3~~TRINITY_DN3384_c0_g3_i2.p1  ORF type:complete len:370 (-),score=39.94 TRINITY_DN3384_c0_g3_i2:193-1302(-)
MKELSDLNSRAPNARTSGDIIFRKGHIGQLLHLALDLKTLEETSQNIRSQTETREGWQTFYKTKIEPELLRERTPLCGVDIEALKAQRSGNSVIKISGNHSHDAPNVNRPTAPKLQPKQVVCASPHTPNDAPTPDFKSSLRMRTPEKADQSSSLGPQSNRQGSQEKLTPVKNSARPTFSGRTGLLSRHRPMESLRAVESETHIEFKDSGDSKDAEPAGSSFHYEPNHQSNVLFTDDRVRYVYPMDFYLANHPQESNVRVIGYSQAQYSQTQYQVSTEQGYQPSYASFQYAPIRLFRDEGDYAPLGQRSTNALEGVSSTGGSILRPSTNILRMRSYSDTGYSFLATPRMDYNLGGFGQFADLPKDYVKDY